jgi:hypothetical protein
MLSLAGLSFLMPWALVALLSVPVLWWLLRVMPPRPKTQVLPTLFLIRDIQSDVKAAAHTPWWLLLLRALIVALFILALADPVQRLNQTLPGAAGDVLIAVDNGWASAVNWDQRVDKIREVIPQAKRAGRNIVFLPTAPSAADGKLRYSDAMDPDAADKWLSSLSPVPWGTEHTQAATLVAELDAKIPVGHAFFFSDGVAVSQSGAADFLTALQDTGGMTLVRDEIVNAPAVLRLEGRTAADLTFGIEMLHPAPRTLPMSLVAYAADGNVVDELKFDFPSGDKVHELKWAMLQDMRGKVARVALRHPVMASSVHLTDSQWQQRPVGIAADPSRRNDDSYLNEIYYLRRALESDGAVTIDTPENLAAKQLSAIIWPDSAALTASERVTLLEWVEAGGFLIRFAGANLAANPDDPLLPVPLRYGQRAMQGAMTWEKPVKLGAVAQDSPLYGLSVPADVTVTRQILAEPVPEVFAKTWLQLEDGTPLVTGGAVGRGMVVLVHTTAGPDWSNFCYSGLYVESLRRMISLSNGIAGYKVESVLPPMLLMDAYGRLSPVAAGAVARAIDPKSGYTPSAETPPGLYGGAQQFQVFNLGAALPPVLPLGQAPSGAREQSYDLSGEKNLKSEFFKWALLLLALDTLVTLFLRGLLVWPSRRVAAAIAVTVLLIGAPAQAQETDDPSSGIYLAYVETGDQATDNISYAGLKGLAEVINLRTNIKIKGVRAVDPSQDPLLYYPVIYWPMTDAQRALPISAAKNVQTYLAEGGMILFDTRDRQFASGEEDTAFSTLGTRKLRKLTENIRIAELMAVEKGHILTKSFYLLDEFPGLYAGGKLWVEKEPSPNNDSVTSVVIGGNDWAAAWSGDGRFDVVPGGEAQREIAFRFGVNLLMAATAGNYKADQVHVPYILERIGK